MTSFLTAIDPGTTIRDHADAVTIGGEQFSREQLAVRAADIAAGLPDQGPVAVLAEPTIDALAAIVACIVKGVPVVPVPVDSGPREIDYFLRDSRATHWIGPVPHGVTPPSAAGPGAGPDRSAAMIFYTSGTTGAPKGVRLSATALASGIDALASAWQWSADDTVVHGLPLFHLHGLVLGVLASLRIGSKVHHTGSARPAAYAAARGTMYFAVPTIWSRMVADEASARQLSHARLLVSGSAPLPVPVFSALSALAGIEPIERYGMSETLITLSTRPDGDRRPGWVGTPLDGVETRLRTEAGELLDAGSDEVGRLEVRGPMLFDGYLGRPDATAQAWTADGWFVTGDLAVRDRDGMHRIVGRESVDLIKSGGYRIGAGEIETALLDHPGVAESAVVGVPDSDLGQRIVAYVVRAEDASALDEQTLIGHASQVLSKHKRPREVVFVSGLPRNAMGKVQKKLLL
ncbi:AMP-binding protein [Prescottella sp. R16]|uniref:AMP-binding protein n=1 Tax=Prescottella sp. R16 TaxID=3064529 RepID=UPI00272DCE90|nr:AMP-binding protein [Prescottella sp. R16]